MSSASHSTKHSCSHSQSSVGRTQVYDTETGKVSVSLGVLQGGFFFVSYFLSPPLSLSKAHRLTLVGACCRYHHRIFDRQYSPLVQKEHDPPDLIDTGLKIRRHFLDHTAISKRLLAKDIQVRNILFYDYVQTDPISKQFNEIPIQYPSTTTDIPCSSDGVPEGSLHALEIQA